MPNPIRSIHRATALAVTTVGASLALSAGPVLAHIDPDPAEVTAGTVVTVAFGVEHGCDSSNTTQLEFQIPDGVTDAAGVELPGWTVTANGPTVTFAGGDLDAATPQSFSLRFTAPTTPGVIHVPIIQTCVIGELAWIEIAADGQPEPEHPAPEIRVVADPTARPASTIAPQTAVASPASIATPAGDSGRTGLVIGSVVGAVVVIGGAALIVRRRRAPDTGVH